MTAGHAARNDYVLSHQPITSNLRVPVIVDGCVACGKDVNCTVELVVQDRHCAFGALTAAHVRVTEREALQTGSPACCGWADGILEPERAPMKFWNDAARDEIATASHVWQRVL